MVVVAGSRDTKCSIFVPVVDVVDDSISQIRPRDPKPFDKADVSFPARPLRGVSSRHECVAAEVLTAYGQALDGSDSRSG